MMKGKFFSTKIDIKLATRERIAALLNSQLADHTDLLSQVKYAHWNLKGPQFLPLHELFDKLAEEQLAYIDELAERITALGGTALGTLRMAAQHSRLPEYPQAQIDTNGCLEALSERYAMLCASTRAAIDQAAELADQGTADLLTGISRELDKRLWFLEAHLQR